MLADSGWLLGNHSDRVLVCSGWLESADQLWLGAAGLSELAASQGQKGACRTATQ